MATQFFMPIQNILGKNALADSMASIAALGLKKALIVTDGGLSKMGVADQVGKELQKNGIEYEVFDGVNPNPTVSNVNAGLAKLKSAGADCIVSLGGGSSHDCAKGVALVATNGGKISGSASQLEVKRKMLSSKVALKRSVVRLPLAGNSDTMRFTSGIKPMSSMRSASSMTRNSTLLKSRLEPRE